MVKLSSNFKQQVLKWLACRWVLWPHLFNKLSRVVLIWDKYIFISKNFSNYWGRGAPYRFYTQEKEHWNKHFATFPSIVPVRCLEKMNGWWIIHDLLPFNVYRWQWRSQNRASRRGFWKMSECTWVSKHRNLKKPQVCKIIKPPLQLYNYYIPVSWLLYRFLWNETYLRCSQRRKVYSISDNVFK